MSLSGELDSVRTPDILQLLAHSGKSGALALEGARGVARIYLRDGHVVGVFSPTESLARFLAQRGLLEESKVRALLAEKGEPPLKPTELRCLLEIPAADLDALLRQRTFDVVAELLSWSVGHFRFEPGLHSVSPLLHSPIDTSAVLLTASKRRDDLNRTPSEEIAAVSPAAGLDLESWHGETESLGDGGMTEAPLEQAAPKPVRQPAPQPSAPEPSAITSTGEMSIQTPEVSTTGASSSMSAGIPTGTPTGTVGEATAKSKVRGVAWDTSDVLPAARPPTPRAPGSVSSASRVTVGRGAQPEAGRRSRVLPPAPSSAPWSSGRRVLLLAAIVLVAVVATPLTRAWLQNDSDAAPLGRSERVATLGTATDHESSASVGPLGSPFAVATPFLPSSSSTSPDSSSAGRELGDAAVDLDGPFRISDLEVAESSRGEVTDPRVTQAAADQQLENRIAALVDARAAALEDSLRTQYVGEIRALRAELAATRSVPVENASRPESENEVEAAGPGDTDVPREEITANDPVAIPSAGGTAESRGTATSEALASGATAPAEARSSAVPELSATRSGASPGVAGGSATVSESTPTASPGSGNPDEVYVPPSLIELPRPVYPSIARRIQRTAEVSLLVRVAPDGTAEEIEVLETTRGFGFDKVAIAAARRGRWQPATSDGEPVRGWSEIKVVFRP